MSSLVLVVALPEDSGYAPSRTFAVSYDQVLLAPSTPPPSAACVPPTCAVLPRYGSLEAQFVVSPSLEQPPPLGVGWNLDNPMNTSLPVTATFRLLWPVGGSALADAESLGLPVGPIQATIAADDLGIPGPASGLATFYQTYLPFGTYTRIVTPSAPFDQAFPPEVKPVDFSGQLPPSDLAAIDSTVETGQGPTIPTFDITSANGPLDGWTAYLRDGSNEIISNVVNLHGTTTTGVVLATNHVPTGADALTNAELVIAPPPGAPIPTGIFAPVGNDLPPEELYPALLPPMTVSGQVAGVDGTPVAADLIFEALAVSGANGASFPSNFEFTAWASASPGASTDSTYSVVLPQGRYRVSVRPRDGVSEVTIVTPPFVVGAGADAGAANTSDFVVDVLRTVQGQAVVADGRPLAAATVEAFPVGCTDGTSVWCLPRDAQTITDAHGSFDLALDPGQYILRVEPAQGTHLPWVVQPLPIPTGNLPNVPSVKIPAGTSVGLSLFDPSGDPMIHALVRAFLLPTTGVAVEVGSALTGTDGKFDMYLTLPSQ